MKALLASLALGALAAISNAQTIETGYYSDGAGHTCRCEVSDVNGSGTPGLEVTCTDAGGSSATTGTQASGSTDTKPKASSFKETSTPRGDTYRGKDGKVQRKNAAGNYVNMRKVKAPKGGKRNVNRDQPKNAGPENIGSLPQGPQSL